MSVVKTGWSQTTYPLSTTYLRESFDRDLSSIGVCILTECRSNDRRSAVPDLETRAADASAATRDTATPSRIEASGPAR